MSYQEAMEAAGAEVLLFETFGSYQGEWAAKVRYNGQQGWVVGYYGSCSHCDAFEAEFGWTADQSPDYQERLAVFGKSELEQFATQDEAQAEWDRKSERDSFYSDDKALANFIRENAW